MLFFEMCESCIKVKAAMLVIAIIKLEKGEWPRILKEVWVSDGLILFILLVTIGLPEIGEVEVEVGISFIGSRLGHSSNPQLLVNS